jgi:hypothetical protein
MLAKLASAAVLLALLSAVAGQAQTAAQIGGPRELPPASFEGQQYVDSRGCVFLRAGYGGAVNWVPRVDARRKVICGFPPTFGPKAPIEVAEEVPAAPPVVAPPAPRVAVAPPAPRVAVALPAPVIAPAPQPARRVAAPLPSPLPMPAATVAVTPPAPYAETPPARQVQVETVASGPGPGKIGCYASAPVAEVVRLTNGGLAVVCTRGDGGVSGWRPPIYPAGRGVGAALSYPTREASATAGISAAATYAAAQNAIPTPPKGYRLAWTDGRLNPLRGVGTAEGQAAQDRVWTREVPARQVVVAAAPPAQPQIRASTKTQPTAPVAQTQTPAASGPAYVQVGSFGVPANAEGAAARLKALGLPVAKSAMTSGGKALQVVYAGPFASAAAAAQALSLARGAGFSDAFIR